MPQRPQEADLVIPASVSNLGPGFDALSVAVQLYLRVRIVEILPGSPGVLGTSVPRPIFHNRVEAAFRPAVLPAGAPAARRAVESQRHPPGRGARQRARDDRRTAVVRRATAPSRAARLLEMAARWRVTG